MSGVDAGAETAFGSAESPEREKRPDSAINTGSRIALPNRIQVTLRRDDVACGFLATVAAPASPRCADALGLAAADGGAGRGVETGVIAAAISGFGAGTTCGVETSGGAGDVSAGNVVVGVSECCSRATDGTAGSRGGSNSAMGSVRWQRLRRHRRRDGWRLALERPSGREAELPEVLLAGRHEWVVGSQRRAGNGIRPSIAVFRIGRFPQTLAHDAEVVEGIGEIGMIEVERGLLKRNRVAQESLR